MHAGSTTVRRALGLGLLAMLVVLVPSACGGVNKEVQVRHLPDEAKRATAKSGDDNAKEKKSEQQEAKEKPEKKVKRVPEYAVWGEVQVGNVAWRVTSRYLTNQLNSSFGTHKRGRFVVIDFWFTNNRDEEVTLDPELHMVLKDTQGREFGPDPDAYEFMPTDLDISLEPVNPGVSKAGRVIYQVPADATGFTLTLDDVELGEDEKAVLDLGVLQETAYVNPSAAATATASPGPSSGESSDHFVTCDDYMLQKEGDCISPNPGEDWVRCRAPSREAVTRDPYSYYCGAPKSGRGSGSP